MLNESIYIYFHMIVKIEGMELTPFYFGISKDVVYWIYGAAKKVFPLHLPQAEK